MKSESFTKSNKAWCCCFTPEDNGNGVGALKLSKMLLRQFRTLFVNTVRRLMERSVHLILGQSTLQYTGVRIQQDGKRKEI